MYNSHVLSSNNTVKAATTAFSSESVRTWLVGAYHSGPGSTTDKDYITEFPKRDSVVRCMICIVAFGMGIDIPDVSYMFHFGISASYWQDVGRAGREGQASYFFATAASKYQKPIPDKGMLSLVEKLSGDAECVQSVCVLQQLIVDGMDQSTMYSRCALCRGPYLVVLLSSV